MSRFRSTSFWAVAIAAACALNFVDGAMAQAQQVTRSSLFQDADRALERARQARAEVLAPRTFGDGMKRYQEAARDFERGRSPEDYKEKLESAADYFEEARSLAQMAYPILSTALAARDDAESAEAQNFAPELLVAANERFERAAREHESGDVEDARKGAQEAESLYRNAELEAIKTNYLRETRDLIRQARDGDVHKRAAKTLARAEVLVTEAERLLSESRYDTDEARWLAQQAKMEAMHAIYLGTIIRAVEKKEMTFEDVMLASEQELARIAGAVEVAPHFEEGMTETTGEIVDRVELYQDSLAELGRSLREREAELASLEASTAVIVARMGELEQELGGLEEERGALLARMEDQARLRQKFTTVERMFNAEEARVIREGGDVIIRLISLTFPVGKSTIEQEHRGVLDRVQRAILEFPGSRVSVEGHTDSFGSDRTNLQLSQQRAEAVRSYLLSNPGLQPPLVEAIGYGESRPVASNDTQDGRARNRRTDIVIHTEIGIGY
jgi:outer membrane protein OmpA-like peptidoglycan-associated protein